MLPDIRMCVGVSPFLSFSLYLSTSSFVHSILLQGFHPPINDGNGVCVHIRPPPPPALTSQSLSARVT